MGALVAYPRDHQPRTSSSGSKAVDHDNQEEYEHSPIG